jgi:hypothetical protein
LTDIERLRHSERSADRRPLSLQTVRERLILTADSCTLIERERHDVDSGVPGRVLGNGSTTIVRLRHRSGLRIMERNRRRGRSRRAG